MTGKVILLTGAPATGKSSLSRAVRDQMPEVEVVDYGQLLLDKKKEH